MTASSQDFVMNPIVKIVQITLSQAVDRISLPPLPLQGPESFQNQAGTGVFTDADAYVINALPATVWMQCMLGLDFMQGVTATIAGGSYHSAHALARSAIESFAFALWVGDDRVHVNERYLRALMLNRKSVKEERSRYVRATQASKREHDDGTERSFHSRLRLIDSAIAHFSRQLREENITPPVGVPSRSQAVSSILADVSPIPGQIYGTLSAGAHADPIFSYGLLEPHPDRVRPPGSDDHVLLSTSVLNHLVPTYHAISAMAIAVGVSATAMPVDWDLDAVAALLRDIEGFMVHNGDEPIWFPADAPVTDEHLHSLDWYLESKSISLDDIHSKWNSTVAP